MAISPYFTVSTLLDLWEWNIGRIISPKNDPTYNKIGKLILLAIGNARIHFSKEALRTPEYFGKDDAPLKGRFEALNGFVEAFIKKSKMEGLAERIQKWIVDLPLKNHEPKVTNVTTSYADGSEKKGMSIQVHGNFIYSLNPHYRPSLSYCGKIYHCERATTINCLEFLVDEKPGTKEKTYEPVALTIPYETGYVPAVKSTQAEETFRWQQVVIPERAGKVIITYTPLSRSGEHGEITAFTLATNSTPHPPHGTTRWQDKPRGSFSQNNGQVQQTARWETESTGWIKYEIDLETQGKWGLFIDSIKISSPITYTWPGSEDMATCKSHFKPPQILSSTRRSVKVQLQITPSTTCYKMDFRIGFFIYNKSLSNRKESPFQKSATYALMWKETRHFFTKDTRIDRIRFDCFDGSSPESTTEVEHPFLIQNTLEDKIQFRCLPYQLENYE